MRVHGWENQPVLGQHHNRSEMDELIAGKCTDTGPDLALMGGRRARWECNRDGDGGRWRWVRVPRFPGDCIVGRWFAVVMVFVAAAGEFTGSLGAVFVADRFGVGVSMEVRRALVGVDMHLGIVKPAIEWAACVGSREPDRSAEKAQEGPQDDGFGSHWRSHGTLRMGSGTGGPDCEVQCREPASEGEDCAALGGPEGCRPEGGVQGILGAASGEACWNQHR